MQEERFLSKINIFIFWAGFCGTRWEAQRVSPHPEHSKGVRKSPGHYCNLQSGKWVEWTCLCLPWGQQLGKSQTWSPRSAVKGSARRWCWDGTVLEKEGAVLTPPFPAPELSLPLRLFLSENITSHSFASLVYSTHVSMPCFLWELSNETDCTKLAHINLYYLLFFLWMQPWHSTQLPASPKNCNHFTVCRLHLSSSVLPHHTGKFPLLNSQTLSLGSNTPVVSCVWLQAHRVISWEK